MSCPARKKTERCSSPARSTRSAGTSRTMRMPGRPSSSSISTSTTRSATRTSIPRSRCVAPVPPSKPSRPSALGALGSLEDVPSDRQRPPRLRPIAPGTIADNVRASEGVSDEELVSRLYEALADLPQPERAAAVVAFGLGEGHRGVAEELGIDPDDADALTRNALQLLRAALGDVDLDEPAFFGRMERRRGHRTAHPDSTSES